ncbi:MAG: DoxX family protein [Candidatus Eremiobacteraeota bacterium]|nr:DoxX family protein [Candidatus Eremiobacteraeota bacterium]
MLPSPLTYATWLAVIRIYSGIFWLAHGLAKLLGPGFFGPSGMMANFLHDATAHGSGPFNDFLQNVVLHNTDVFSHLVAWGETLTGVALLLGLATRVGGFFGVFLALNYFLMKGSYAHITALGGLEAAAMALSLISLVLPTGLVWGFDGMLQASRSKRQSAGKT